MAQTLDKVLGYQYLGGLIEEIKTGVPNDLPPAMLKSNRKVIGDSAVFTRYAGTRKTARRSEYGASARRRELSPISSQPIKLLHFFEEQQLKVQDYQNLRAYDSYQRQDMGKQEVARQIKQFKAIFQNTRISTIASVLAKGKIWFDAGGNLLPSSSGAVLTVDIGVSANNQNQLNGVIGASWATAGTDIPGHIRALQARSLQLTGYPIKYAFYGKDIPTYITNNTAAQVYLSRNPQKNQQYLDTGELPDGMFDLTWVPAYRMFYEDSTGTNQKWFADDAVTFTPEIDDDLYEIVEGSYGVPTTFQPFGDLKGAMASFEQVYGQGGYAVPIQNPLTASIYSFDTFLPWWKVADALFLADVVP